MKEETKESRTKIYYFLKLMIRNNLNHEELNRLYMDYLNYLKTDAISRDKIHKLMKIKVH